MKDENQSGRTLLEMLGVLAIMGIITYGAIAGINYGMTSYKINQTYAEVQEIVQGIQDLYSWSSEYPSEMMKAACKNNIFSGTCACTTDTCTYENGPFGSISVQQQQPRDASGNVSGNANPKNFEVEVTIDENVMTRITGLDWSGLNLNADCGPRGSNYTCIFSPL